MIHDLLALLCALLVLAYGLWSIGRIARRRRP